MKRTDFFAELANLLTVQLGAPYSDEPLTEAQLDCYSDALLLRIEQIKKEMKHDSPVRTNQ